MTEPMTTTEALELDRQASKLPNPPARPVWITAGEVLAGGLAFLGLTLLLAVAHLFIQGL